MKRITPIDFGATSRRQFIKRASAITAFAGTPFAANLLAIGEAAAQADDGKALVCIFMNGGNDHSNMIVPVSGNEYATYAAIRGQVALQREQILPVQPRSFDGPSLGFNQKLAGLKSIFDQGKLAVIANVGTLAAPISLRQWNGGSPTVAVPTQLFSHMDQSGSWQTGVPDRPCATGWLGRIGDMTASRFNTGSPVSIAMSVGGNNLFQTGQSTIQYQLTVDGAVKVQAIDSLYGQKENAELLKRLITAKRSNLLEAEFARTNTRGFAAESVVTGALASTNLSTPFPGTPVGKQLKMVARLIAARSALSQRRQIFFVKADGYDFHDRLVEDQSQRFIELNDAMVAFYQATQEIGAAERVTTFTTSDFGRTLQTNGRGSDHGWGAHHFVMGGAVKGGSVYGTFPPVALKTSQDVGQGRLLPTTSVDEYAATLAQWFGVSDSDLSTVLPNLARFSRSNMSFLT